MCAVVQFVHHVNGSYWSTMLLADMSCDVFEMTVNRGIIAVILAFVLFGVTSMPDGPFLRPHPGIWLYTFV